MRIWESLGFRVGGVQDLGFPVHALGLRWRGFGVQGFRV